MIVEYFLAMTGHFVTGIGGLFPDATLPDWFVNLSANLNAFFARFDGVGVWVNWAVVGPMITLTIGWWLIGLLIKLVRVVIGHIPAFGGNG